MSRCFPFPPPGYEKKLRTESVDLLKKEKHKSKKDKKEKKDREKKDGKERRHKDKNKEKHGENDKQEKDREKKKDKDREKKKDKEREKKDMEKSRDKGGGGLSNERTPEQPAGSLPEPKHVEARQKAEDINSSNNKKFVEDLRQRIRNEVAGDRMVENTSRMQSDGRLDSTTLQKRSFNEMVQNPSRPDDTLLQKRVCNEMVQNPARLDGTIFPKRTHNEMVQNSASIQKKIGDTSIVPEGKVTGNSLVHNIGVELDVRSRIEGQKDAHKKSEKRDKATDQVNIGKAENDANKKSGKRDKTTDQVNLEKIEKHRDKEKKKDRKDREKTKDGKDRDKEKNKDGKDRHKNKVKKKEKDRVKDKKHKDNKKNADVTTPEPHILNNLVRNDTEKKQPPSNIVPPNDTEKQHQSDGDLKRKVVNGFLHEARPNKLPKVVPSSLLPLENGRKLDLQHIGVQNNSDKQVTPNSIKLPSPQATPNSIKLPSPQATSNSIKLPSPSDSKDQKLNGTVQLPTPTAPLIAVARASEIDEVSQRSTQPGPSRISLNAVTRDATEIHEGSQRPPQSLPPRVSSNSASTDAADVIEGSQRPPKPLPPRASLNAVAGVTAGANEDPQRPPQALPTKLSHKAVVRDAGENGEGHKRPPHPDEKYLGAILHVPKLDDWPETDDQEWLFKNGDLLQKKRKLKVEANEELQVWAKAQRIESSDVLALPYVIPY